MFGFASSFNQNIGAWNVSNVSNFVQMFYAAIAFNNGESPDINNWTFNTVSDINMSQMFSVATSFNQNIGSWNISKVTEVRSLFHQASNFNNGGSPDINNWNTSSCVNMSYMFADAKQFNQNIGNWNISKVTNFSNMFSGEVNFDNGGSSDINNWVLNSASDIDMSYMFAGGGGDTIQRFNQPIGNWNTSKVTNMSYMFSRSGNGINLFNQDIGNWNVSNVTNMAAMFYKATNFNQNIGNWDVSKVINMASMFGDAPTFNNGESSDINNWKTSAATNMSGTFYGATNFNQPIGNWNVSNVVYMTAMLASTKFNQNIGSWDVSKVTNFQSTFYNSRFNNGGSSDINNWNTSSATTMAAMFATARSFNQPINNWSVSNVTNMNQMFYEASLFNQNIGNWDTSKVTAMSQMFQAAEAFDQNIGNWNVSNVDNLTSFMPGKRSNTFSNSNLDAIYNGWSSRPVKPNLNINFGTAKYTSGGMAGKAILENSPNNWTITDGGS